MSENVLFMLATQELKMMTEILNTTEQKWFLNVQ